MKGGTQIPELGGGSHRTRVVSSKLITAEIDLVLEAAQGRVVGIEVKAVSERKWARR